MQIYPVKDYDSLSFAPAPLFVDIITRLEETNYFQQAISHVETGYQNVYAIFAHIETVQKNHNSNISSFIKEAKDKIQKYVDAIGLSHYQISMIFDHYWKESQDDHRELIIRISQVNNQATFELCRYGNESEIAIGDRRSLDLMKATIESQIYDVNQKLKKFHEEFEAIRVSVRDFKLNIDFIINDIDAGIYKGVNLNVFYSARNILN